MKQLARLLSLLILVSAGIFFSNCGGSDDKEPSAEETQLNALATSWDLTSVTLEGDPADQFDGADVTLTLSGNYSEGGKYNYTISSSVQIDASPFPAAGKWKFGSPVTSKIVRLDSEVAPAGTFDDVELSYELNGTTLEITIPNYQGSNFVIGRTASVEGTWVFTFTKAN